MAARLMRCSSTYFNSRPHEEVDKQWFRRCLMVNISTHDLTKRSTSPRLLAFRELIFQLTTSRRGRPYIALNNEYHMPFQLTTSRRGRLMDKLESVETEVFQLTTSRRGRLVDDKGYFGGKGISTHDLTKRSTFYSRWRIFDIIISTHDLTKRSTS